MNYERLIGKPVNWLFLSVLAYLSLLPVVFSCLSYWKVRCSWTAVCRFSETSGRKMNSRNKQLWDKPNHQERSIEWTASRFFPPPNMLVQWPFISKVSHIKFCLLILYNHMGRWYKALYFWWELNNSEPRFCLMVTEGNCSSSKSSAVSL